MQKKLTNNKVLIMASIIGSLSMPNSYASDWDELPQDINQVNYTEGHVGAGSGAITGAALGGPPGLVLGAIIGKLIGRDQGMQQRIDERELQLQQLQVLLKSHQQARSAWQQDKTAKQVKVASIANVSLQSVPNMTTIIEQGVAFSVHFRTDSEQIEKHIIEQSRSFIALAKIFPQLVVNLHGYADSRGTSSYNLSLSKRRLEAVRRLLIAQGIDGGLIQVSALGEDELLNSDEDPESHSFERRVVITFSQRGDRS